MNCTRSLKPCGMLLFGMPNANALAGNRSKSRTPTYDGAVFPQLPLELQNIVLSHHGANKYNRQFKTGDLEDFSEKSASDAVPIRVRNRTVRKNGTTIDSRGIYVR